MGGFKNTDVRQKLAREIRYLRRFKKYGKQRNELSIRLIIENNKLKNILRGLGGFYKEI